MKTITEMQLQIRNMSAQLDTLAMELEQFGKIDKKKQEVNFDSIYEIAMRNPITDHYLQEQDISVKKSYLTMLIVLVCMVKQNQENAWILVQRIAIGGGYEESIQKLQVDALSFSDEYLNRFTYDLVEAGVNQAFALDAMLLYLICETSNADMLEFISELLGLLKCDKKQVREITELAKSIVQQDNGIYNSKSLANIDEEELAVAYCYIKEFNRGLVLNTSDGKKYILQYTNIGDIYEIGAMGEELLKWKVIGKEKGKSLILCEQSIAMMDFKEDNWKLSSIRNYLNGEFLLNFNENQRKNIIKNNDNDLVFLLSKDEIEKYLLEQKQRVLKETQTTNRDFDEGLLEWWIRTRESHNSSLSTFSRFYGASITTDNPYYIDKLGQITEWILSGFGCFDRAKAVRPAFWLNI